MVDGSRNLHREVREEVINEIRGFLMLWKLEKKAKEVAMDQTKPGWKTTEFWITLIPQIPVIAGLFLGATNPIVLGIAAATSIAYTIIRSNHKEQMAGILGQAALDAAAKKAAEGAPQS